MIPRQLLRDGSACLYRCTLEAKEPVLKRPFDILLSVAALVMSLPLLVVVALAIFLEDRGSVLFVQERCGKGGKLFGCMKFRTMKVPRGDAVHQVVDMCDDARVTKVGRILRLTALDELPQLVNILKGEMSFVGPRPLPYRIEDEESACYKTIAEVPGYQLRTQVRPGLTGLAQIYAPRDVDRRNKFRYDNLYVRKMTFWLDMKLVLLALWVTLRGRWEGWGQKV